MVAPPSNSSPSTVSCDADGDGSATTTSSRPRNCDGSATTSTTIIRHCDELGAWQWTPTRPWPWPNSLCRACVSQSPGPPGHARRRGVHRRPQRDSWLARRGVPPPRRSPAAWSDERRRFRLQSSARVVELPAGPHPVHGAVAPGLSRWSRSAESVSLILVNLEVSSSNTTTKRNKTKIGIGSIAVTAEIRQRLALAWQRGRGSPRAGPSARSARTWGCNLAPGRARTVLDPGARGRRAEGESGGGLPASHSL